VKLETAIVEGARKVGRQPPLERAPADTQVRHDLDDSAVALRWPK